MDHKCTSVTQFTLNALPSLGLFFACTGSYSMQHVGQRILTKSRIAIYSLLAAANGFHTSQPLKRQLDQFSSFFLRTPQQDSGCFSAGDIP